MKILKFNESSNYFKIKDIINNLDGMLVDFNDHVIKYIIEPSNDIRIKLVSLENIDYDGFYLQVKDLSINLSEEVFECILEKIETVKSYMYKKGFESIIEVNHHKFSIEELRSLFSRIIQNRHDKGFRFILDNIEVKFILLNKPITEGLPNQKTIDQLKMVMKMSAKTDIGNRISDMNKQGANIDYIQNPINNGIESYEDYEKHNKKFKSSWNLKHLIGPFDPEPKPKVEFELDYKQKQDKVK